jgi:dienelactone hydrolase
MLGVKLVALLFAATTLLVPAKLVTRTVDYSDAQGTPLEGYIVYDDAKSGLRPGVIVIHDWRGLTDYTHRRAAMLAGLGYVALEADIYGKGVRPASVPEYSRAMAPYKANRDLYRARVRAAYNVFLRQPEVDPEKIAAIGYCFGGTGVIELVRDGAPVLGVVSFHGGLDARPVPSGKRMTAKVLALCGADDPFEKPDDMQAFVAQMRENGVDLKVVEYPGAVHAFTDPGVDALNLPGAKYNAEADRQSWAAMKAFLEKIFS